MLDNMPMSYQVLALKYRPQTFDQVVGQAHVTTTLTNAIAADRVAHAILFTGPRGTGKTTIARVLAKAMTCSQGPTATPCNTCKICTDIIQGHCSDVFEIDGASNNSVDQIRDLRENVTYMPASARYKIYIIDEVHMLSTAAFNALLKTLEEPPVHVLFIFATTEVHKIPATILSRCQRHDLGRIALSPISDHLGALCEKEGFSLDRDSLDLISMEADGSIRDGLSLLDRVLSSSPDKNISHDQVIDNLGVMDRTLMFDLSSAVFTKDGAALISLVETVNDSGLDLKKFYSNIILHFRNLNIIKLCGSQNPGLNLTDTEKDKLSQATAQLSQNYLGMLLQLLLDEETLVRFSSHTKTAVEMVLLKLIQINVGAQLDQVIAKLDLLARQIDTKLAESGHMPAPVMPPSTEPAMVPSETQQPPQREPQMQGPTQHQSQPPPDQALATPHSVEPPEPQESTPNTWQGFLEKIQKKLPFIFALISKGRVNTALDTHIHVELDTCSSFEKTRLKTKNQELQELSKKYLGKPIKIDIKTEASPLQPQDTNKKVEDQARQAASRHPMVLEAQRLFNGEII